LGALQPNVESVLKAYREWMMRSAAVTFMLGALLTGCGGSGSESASAPPASTATMNFVVQDTPSPKLTVLSFQIEITGAVLQPGNVSILPKPVTVDLAQLVSDTAFLSSTVLNSTTFTSLTLTFADPQVTIVNNSSAAIVTPTQTCAVGATCTFVPKLNAASVTISSGVFPITVTANSSTGLALDLSIPDLLQSDLSVTAADGTSVNLSLLPTPAGGAAEAQIDDVLGMVQSVSAGQIQIKTAVGDTLVLSTDSSTAYNYPSSACSANNSTCVVANQLVTVDLSLLAAGTLHTDSVSFADSAASTVVQGVVLSVGTGVQPVVQVLVHKSLPSSAGFTVGEIVDATLQSGAAMYVASPGYPAVSGGTFVSASDLLAGQEVLLEVTQTMPAGTDGNAAFTTGLVSLQSSQILGRVNSVNADDSEFELTNVWSLFSSLSPAIPQLQVQTGTQTSFVGVTPASVSGVAAGDNVRVKGPVFNTAGGSGQPTMGAVQVSGRP
jgi:hypothetical protein